jgi:hypothetical protein
VHAQVGDLQVTHGGPLITVQMDKEHGMISGGNESYMVEMQRIFTGAGFDTQLFTCDPGRGGRMDALPGVLRGRNGYKGRQSGSPEAESPAVHYPLFVPELFPRDGKQRDYPGFTIRSGDGFN